MKVEFVEKNGSWGLGFQPENKQELINLGLEPFKTKESSLITWFWLFNDDSESIQEMVIPLKLGIELFLARPFDSIKEQVEYFADYANIDNIPHQLIDIIKIINQTKIIQYLEEMKNEKKS